MTASHAIAVIHGGTADDETSASGLLVFTFGVAMVAGQRVASTQTRQRVTGTITYLSGISVYLDQGWNTGIVPGKVGLRRGFATENMGDQKDFKKGTRELMPLVPFLCTSSHRTSVIVRAVV
jgi:hypothetical protein